MGTCEPGQVRNQAAISGNFYVPGVLVQGRVLLFLDDCSGCADDYDVRIFAIFTLECRQATLFVLY